MISVDDNIIKVMWSKRFTKAQGFKVKLKFVFQENASTIKLGENVKFSSGKSARYFDIRLFNATDLISRKEIKIKCCLTGKILADHFSKPLIGKLFHVMRSDAMNVALRE